MPAKSQITGLSVKQVSESLLGSDKCIYGKSLLAFISSLQVRWPIKRTRQWRCGRVSDKRDVFSVVHLLTACGALNI